MASFIVNSVLNQLDNSNENKAPNDICTVLQENLALNKKVLSEMNYNNEMNCSNAKLPNNLQIPTNIFYSKITEKVNYMKPKIPNNISKPKKRAKRSILYSQNKVSKHHLNTSKNHREDLIKIFNKTKNEKLKSIIKNTIETLKDTSIKVEKEKSTTIADEDSSDDDSSGFSDCSTEFYENESNINRFTGDLAILTENNTRKNGKFFKSGKQSKYEFEIANNIKVGLSKGRFSLITRDTKRKHHQKAKKSKNLQFDNTSELVNKIIDNLDKVPETDISKEDVIEKAVSIIKKESLEEIKYEKYENFRKRLPYKTDDPKIINNQNFLLDFLIANDVCTEANFNIFIVDLENNLDIAQDILFNIANPEFNAAETVIMKSLREKTDTQKQNDTDLENMEEALQKHKQLLFSIFYSKTTKLIPPSSKRKHRKFSNYMGLGLKQLQIDAGQKEFGAIQCTICGLLYSTHEPEEEKLHNDYHNSITLLKYQSCPEDVIVGWLTKLENSSKIIRIVSNSSDKRKQKVLEVLKIVDKELGYITENLPTPFISFLAVCNSTVIGFCLLEQRNKANRFCMISGLPCCTQEEYPVKCGISRIWVSPFYRRKKVAVELINCVKNSTFLYNKITMDDIAFSSPTMDGINLARAVSKRNDFLVY